MVCLHLLYFAIPTSKLNYSYFYWELSPAESSANRVRLNVSTCRNDPKKHNERNQTSVCRTSTTNTERFVREWCHHMRTNRLIHQVRTWLTSHPYTIYIAGFWFHVNVRALQRCLSTICWPTLLASSFTQPSEIFSNNHGSFTHTMCNLQRQTQELQLADVQTQKHNHP